MSNSVLKTATRKGDFELSENEVSVGASAVTENATGQFYAGIPVKVDPAVPPGTVRLVAG